MRILLVQPLPGQIGPGQFLRSCVVEPLGIGYLAGYLISKGHNVSICYPLRCTDEFADTVRMIQPDIIGYSVYTFALTEALMWAKLAKKYLPGIVNVFGGYHPTGDPSVCINPEVDYVVVGEGEKPMLALIHYLETGVETSDLSAVVYRMTWEKGVRPTVVRLDKQGLDSFLPVRDPAFLAVTKHYQLSYPPPSQQRSLAQVLYARGCPHECSFCTSRKMWGGQIIRRSPEMVIAEIARLRNEYGTNLVFFADLCLNASREALLDLCDLLKKASLGVSWWGLFRPECLDRELLEKMVMAGCVKISVGIDHDAILDGAFQPRKGLSLCTQALDIAHSLGLIVRGLMMVGFPWETEEYLLSLAERLADSYDELRIAFCCPFPGTKLWEEVRRRNLLISQDWADMDSDRPILRNERISSDRYLEIRKEILNSFLWSRALRQRVQWKILKYPHLFQSYNEFAEYLACHDVVSPPEMTQTNASSALLRNDLQDEPTESIGSEGVNCIKARERIFFA